MTFFFGLCLGCGLLTRIRTSFYVLIAWALLGGNLLVNAIVFGVFGLARVIRLWVIDRTSATIDDRDRLILMLHMGEPASRTLLGIVLASAGGVLIVVAVLQWL
jgi:hypothetical protein